MARWLTDCTASLLTNDLGLKSNKSVLQSAIAAFGKGFIAFKPQVDQLESHSQLFFPYFTEVEYYNY